MNEVNIAKPFFLSFFPSTVYHFKWKEISILLKLFYYEAENFRKSTLCSKYALLFYIEDKDKEDKGLAGPCEMI